MAKEVVGGMTEQILYLSRENDILKRQLLAQGEQLSQEILERKTEVDRLKIQIEAMKKLLEQENPGFIAQFEKFHAKEQQSFDPELERSAS